MYGRLICIACILVNHVRFVDSMASNQSEQCPNPSGSIYRHGEGLEVIPDIPNIDYCSRVDFSHNRIGTLINGHCRRCDFVDLSYNNLTEVNTALSYLYPNAKHVRLNNNNITWIEAGALKGLRRIDLENNPLEHFPFDSVPSGTKLYLKNVILPCDCSMKKAIERGVEFVTPPTCKGYPGVPYMEILTTLKCKQVKQVDANTTSASYRPTTDPVTEKASEVPVVTSSGCSSGVQPWVVAVIVIVFVFVAVVVTLGIVKHKKLSKEIQQMRSWIKGQQQEQDIADIPDGKLQPLQNGTSITQHPSNNNKAIELTPLTNGQASPT